MAMRGRPRKTPAPVEADTKPKDVDDSFEDIFGTGSEVGVLTENGTSNLGTDVEPIENGEGTEGQEPSPEPVTPSTGGPLVDSFEREATVRIELCIPISALGKLLASLK